MSAALAVLSSSASSVSIATFISQPKRRADVIHLPAPKKLVTASRADLAKAVDAAASIISGRNTIPILSNVRLTGRGDHVEVISTDLDIEIVADAPATASRFFDVTIPAADLKAFLKKGKASEIAIEQLEDTARIDLGKVRYDVQTLPTVDFPDVSGPVAEEAKSFTMDGEAFVSGLIGTADAMSSEETRYYLRGIFLHVYDYGANGPEIRMVATDGHRLHRQSFAVPAGAEGMPGVIVPRNTVTTLMKLMKGKNVPADVKISVTSARIRFEWKGFSVTSKLVDGTFPDYNRVIPAYHDKTAVIDACDLQEALEAVSLISSERGRAVKMDFDQDRKSCVITVNNPDKGRSEAAITASYDGDPLEIGFNARYLDDLLTLAGEHITFKFSDCGSPTLVTGDRDGWMACLMPMRV